MAWALIKGGKVAEVFSGTRSVTIDDVQHPYTIFGPSWSDEDRAKIGLFPVAQPKGRDLGFRKKTGAVIFDKDKKTVYETVEVDIDDAKNRVRGGINQRADGLVKAAIPEGRFCFTIARLMRLMLRNGGDVSKWPKADLTTVEADLRAFSYIETIEAERVKRLSAADALDSVQACIDFDVNGDWPSA